MNSNNCNSVSRRPECLLSSFVRQTLPTLMKSSAFIINKVPSLASAPHLLNNFDAFKFTFPFPNQESVCAPLKMQLFCRCSVNSIDISRPARDNVPANNTTNAINNVTYWQNTTEQWQFIFFSLIRNESDRHSSHEWCCHASSHWLEQTWQTGLV